VAARDRPVASSGRIFVTNFDSRTIIARQVLLDAIEALQAHRPALVVVGAQAIYLHTGTGETTVAAYTFDGDLVLDPTLLDDDPRLEEVMSGAGFTLLKRNDRTQPGTWVTSRRDGLQELTVPVDLIVPEAFAPGSHRRRSVRVGAHDRLAIRRTHGLEAALVDNSLMHLPSFVPGDERSVDVRVAGPAALLIAKLHKLSDRSAPDQPPDRLRDKDAADVYRLMQTFQPEPIADKFTQLSGHPQAGAVTEEAIGFLRTLFATPRSTGTLMAASALSAAIPETRVGTVSSAWTRTFLSAVD
jgi:hypothetical protein